MLDASRAVDDGRTSPSARHSHAMAAVGTDIYLFGGYSGEELVFRLSIITKEWTMLDAAAGVTGTSPSARFDHAMAAVGTDIYLYGGSKGKGCDWWKGRGQTKGMLGGIALVVGISSVGRGQARWCGSKT